LKKGYLNITTAPDELNEGLFGQLALYIFEVLPYLQAASIYPAWDIKSPIYGVAPGYKVIPGAFDLNYDLETKPVKDLPLYKLREEQTWVLGGNWNYLHSLWTSYFKVPERILKMADEAGDLQHSLAIHYRGNDKNAAVWDTNPVSYNDYIILIKDFIQANEDIDSIFVATDEFAFVTKLEEEFTSLKIINLGEVGYHKKTVAGEAKFDRAVLDCVLLSRCRHLLMTSSALASFAKVLNPALDCYRVSASKAFEEIPYFPVAYIPKLTSNNSECTAILQKLFEGDWLHNEKLRKKFGGGFTKKKRYILPAGARKILFKIRYQMHMRTGKLKRLTTIW
jgi:hypothetical protein